MSRARRTEPIRNAAGDRLAGSRSLGDSAAVGAGRAAGLDDEPDWGSARVLTVVDTREYIEGLDERWVPVAGSGDGRECDRCGRTHEVHATVDVGGREFTVGVGCAVSDGAASRRLSAQAGKDRQQGMSAARSSAADEVLSAAIGEVAVVVFPDDRVVYSQPTDGPWPHQWQVDGVMVRGFNGCDPAERVRCLQSSWRHGRLVELVGGHDELRRLARRASIQVPWN